MTKRLVARANILLFGVLVGILILVGGVTWERLNAARDAREWSQHSNQVLFALKDLAIAVRDAETGQRGYLLTEKVDYLTPYQAALDRVGVLQGELQKLTADNETQQARLRSLAPLIQRKLEELAQTIQLRHDVGFEAAARLVNTDTGREYMKRIEAEFAALLDQEQALLSQRQMQNDSRAAWVRWLIGGGTLLAIATLLWAAWLLNQA